MPKKQAEIPAFERPEGTIQFSFKHLECDHSRYCIDTYTNDFWQAFTRELKHYNKMQVDQFEVPDNEVARHLIDFTETSEVGFDPAFEQLFDWSNRWQFGIGHKRHGWRAIGVLVGNLFYLVWLDQNHQLYSENVPRI